jgi:hypothetical protein
MKTLFTVNLVVSLIFGFGFVLVPEIMLNTYEANISAELVFMARMFGSALLTLCVILFYVRRTENQEFINTAARALCLYWILGAIWLTVAQLAGLFNFMAWLTVGLHVFFAVWYAYKIFIRP